MGMSYDLDDMDVGLWLTEDCSIISCQYLGLERLIMKDFYEHIY